MDHAVHNKIVSFIWSIADDCLLEPSKDAVMEEVRFQRDDAGLTELDPEGLRDASGYVFYNTSLWILKKLVDTAANNRQILEANFKAYLNGFSECQRDCR